MEIPKPTAPTCDQCGALAVSKSMSGVTTSLGWETTYDAEGRRHDHDPNRTSVGYRCANGHDFYVLIDNSCWCGWPATA